MSEEFKFPSDLTRRERWMFEKYAGCTMAKFVEIVSDEANHSNLTVDMEAALLLIAVRRQRGQTVTFENVLDSDWVLGAPDEPGESPLPPPPAESENASSSEPSISV